MEVPLSPKFPLIMCHVPVDLHQLKVNLLRDGLNLKRDYFRSVNGFNKLGRLDPFATMLAAWNLELK